MKKTIIIGFLLFLLAGCAGLQRASVCDTIVGPSELCQIAAKQGNGVRLDDVGDLLIVANVAAIEAGFYTREKAIQVLEELRDILENPVSYAWFKGQVYLRVDQYPGLLEVATVYFSELGSLSRIMYASDQRILRDYLEKQIKVLGG